MNMIKRHVRFLIVLLIIFIAIFMLSKIAYAAIDTNFAKRLYYAWWNKYRAKKCSGYI